MDKTDKGHIHLINRTIFDIRVALEALGFSVAIGQEMEDEFHNFDALNIPKSHPARDMQDTFWVKNSTEGGMFNPEKSQISSTPPTGDISKGDKSDLGTKHDKMLLRTHTSSVQIRYMEENLEKGIQPPYKIIVPGKVFRNEATDATHEAQFFQVEALYVDKKVSLADLKGTLEYMFKKLFGDDVEIRFRPSFFPFTEPSVEVDMKWKDNWLEMGGAGLVHPNVLKSVDIDPESWQGFAFGFGIDRIAMLRYKVPDVRMFYNGDMRLGDQF